jgi:glycosyltransferase involved in cell wall biosynthesis
MKKLKKILVIADGYPTAKNVFTGIFVKEQLDELKKTHPEISFDLFFNPFFKVFSNTQNKQSPFWTLIKWSMQLCCFIPFLFKKYDLVHAHRFYLPVINGVVFKFFRNVPLIVTSHGIKQIQNRYHSKIVFRLFNYCDMVIAVNEEMRNNFIEHFKLNKNRVITRSCGVDFSAFDEYIKNNPAGNNPKEEIILGFVGDMSEIKRPYLFIKCIQNLYKKYNIRGIMVGGGDRLNEIKEYILKHHLPIDVKGVLPRKKVIPLFYQFDIFIFPSSIEPFGLVGIEALYCSVPVIASRVGGKRDYIKENQNGLFFDPDDLEDLVNKTKYLLDNKDVFNELKGNAKESVKEYANSKIAKDIFEYYKQVFGEQKK